MSADKLTSKFQIIVHARKFTGDRVVPKRILVAPNDSLLHRTLRTKTDFAHATTCPLQIFGKTNPYPYR